MCATVKSEMEMAWRVIRGVLYVHCVMLKCIMLKL